MGGVSPPGRIGHRSISGRWSNILPLSFCTELTMHTLNTFVSSNQDENPVCCSCTVLYVGSSCAEAPERVQQAEFYVLQRYSAALLSQRVVHAHIEHVCIVVSG